MRHKQENSLELPINEKRLEDKKTAEDVLLEMAKTYRERNAIYGENFRKVSQLIAVLFPDGVSTYTLHKEEFQLLLIKLGKITRFVNSNLTHRDSIHDDAVYSALIEQLLIERGIER